MSEKHHGSRPILVCIILLTLAIVPIIVRIATIDYASPLISASQYDTGIKYEAFAYYKFWGLTIGTMAALGAFIYTIGRKGYRINFDYTSLPVAILFLLILFSGILAQYKNVSLVGQLYHYEGTITYLLYLILFFITAHTYFSKRMLEWVFKALYPLVIINFILSVLYFYGIDVLNWPFISSLINLPSSGLGANPHLGSTFGNRDYVSGFGGVVAALFLTRAIFTRDKKIKITNFIFSVISFTMMLSAYATSGFLTFVFAFLVLCVVSLFSKLRRERMIIITGAFILFTLALGLLNSHNDIVWKKTIGYLINSNNYTSASTLKAVPSKGATSKGATSNGATSNGAPPDVALDEFGLPISNYSGGSGRTYIWKKTLELVKAKPISGYGLDTLAYYFPQDDPGKTAGIGSMDIFVDKPHNMYLGIGFGAGIIALLAFCWLLWRHFWQNINFFRKSPNNEQISVLVSLFAAWCAYLIQALFNDSIIGTALVFWILFGVSVSLLRDENQV